MRGLWFGAIGKHGVREGASVYLRSGVGKSRTSQPLPGPSLGKVPFETSTCLKHEPSFCSRISGPGGWSQGARDPTCQRQRLGLGLPSLSLLPLCRIPGLRNPHRGEVILTALEAGSPAWLQDGSSCGHPSRGGTLSSHGAREERTHPITALTFTTKHPTARLLTLVQEIAFLGWI